MSLLAHSHQPAEEKPSTQERRAELGDQDAQNGKIIGRMIARTSRSRKARKSKKSYTLSPESVEFLEMMRKRRHAPSVSSILEEILQAVRREHGKAALERSIADYYSSLSPREVEEQRYWSEFAMRQFPVEDV
jgi:hypothetical protein